MTENSNQNFLKRKWCEICGNADSLKTLLSVPYSVVELSATLLDRYQGNITADDFESAQYKIKYCASCKYVFQTYVPTDTFAQKIYTYPEGRIQKSIEKRIQVSLQKSFGDALRTEVIAVLLGARPYEKSILDFGMGWGGFLSTAKPYGFQVTGVDISDERRTFVERQGIRAVSNLEKLKDEKFDFILADQTLEHVSHPSEYLIALSSRLKKDGIIFIGVPNGNRVYKMLSKRKCDNLFWKVIYPLEHINCFSHDSLVKIAKNAGLKPMHSAKIAKRLLSQVSIFRNAHLAQAALEYMYRFKTSTEIYFIKE